METIAGEPIGATAILEEDSPTQESTVNTGRDVRPDQDQDQEPADAPSERADGNGQHTAVSAGRWP